MTTHKKKIEKKHMNLEEKIEVDEDFFLELFDKALIDAKEQYEIAKELYCTCVKGYTKYVSDKKDYYLKYYFNGDSVFYVTGDKKLIGFKPKGGIKND